MILLVDGEAGVLDSVEDVLRSFGSTIRHVGSGGDAKTIKIVNNAMTNVLGIAEVFTVGVKAGIPPESLFETLNHSSDRSHHFVKRSPKVLVRDFRAGLPAGFGEKDLYLASARQAPRQAHARNLRRTPIV